MGGVHPALPVYVSMFPTSEVIKPILFFHADEEQQSQSLSIPLVAIVKQMSD